MCIVNMDGPMCRWVLYSRVQNKHPQGQSTGLAWSGWVAWGWEGWMADELMSGRMFPTCSRRNCPPCHSLRFFFETCPTGLKRWVASSVNTREIVVLWKMGAFEMVVSHEFIGFRWIYRIIMDQALLQLLAPCLDIIFRFVPSNGFANEEVRDESHQEEHEGYYNEGSRHEYSVS